MEEGGRFTWRGRRRKEKRKRGRISEKGERRESGEEGGTFVQRLPR